VRACVCLRSCCIMFFSYLFSVQTDGQLGDWFKVMAHNSCIPLQVSSKGTISSAPDWCQAGMPTITPGVHNNWCQAGMLTITPGVHNRHGLDLEASY